MTSDEIQAILDTLVLRKRHTDACQTKNGISEWEPLTDNRKRCSCPYWSCGVHDRAEGFKRKSTQEISLERAKAAVRLRLETGNRTARLENTNGQLITEAVTDFLQCTREGGARRSSMAKYQTLMDQLQAFSEWKGYRYLQELGQDAVIEFRRSWEDEDAGYKQGRTNKYGGQLWRKMGPGTCRRSKKTLSLFFRRGIRRKWIDEDPTEVLTFAKQSASKAKEDVKYLTTAQLAAVLAQCDEFKRMTDYNRDRIKALILTMRWTGLRIGDAVLLTTDSITDGVLRLRTRKASTPVQIPLHPALNDALSRLKPYSGGYFFWNRQTATAKTSTPLGNFGRQISGVFQDAGIETDIHLVSHMLRNTFAVDLLEKGLPLETVSLMLGHQSVTTTERYYADFSKGYMDRAEARVRKAWALADGETLD